MTRVQSFRDLLVYQKARNIAREIFELTKRFPKDEIYALTSQVRNSSRSIGAQIAEAWAKRRYEKHFVSKLTDSDGEQLETQHWVETARDCRYLTDAEADRLVSELCEVGRMLGSMVEKASWFCAPYPQMVRESAAGYFVEADEEGDDPQEASSAVDQYCGGPTEARRADVLDY